MSNGYNSLGPSRQCVCHHFDVYKVLYPIMPQLLVFRRKYTIEGPVHRGLNAVRLLADRAANPPAYHGRGGQRTRPQRARSPAQRADDRRVDAREDVVTGHTHSQHPLSVTQHGSWESGGLLPGTQIAAEAGGCFPGKHSNRLTLEALSQQ